MMLRRRFTGVLYLLIIIPLMLGNILCTGQVFKTLLDDSPDNVPPTVVSVMSTALDKVRVEFSKEIDGATAADTLNYTILGLNVIDAAVSANPMVVILTTDIQLNENYNITVENVESVKGKPMAEPYFGTFLGAQNEPRVVNVTAIKVNQIRIEFSEDVDVGSATYTINPSLTYSFTGSVSYSNPYVTITLDTGEEMQDTNYTITVDNVQDLEGYDIHPRYNSMSFHGDARPRIVCISSTDQDKIAIKFSETIDISGTVTYTDPPVGTDNIYVEDLDAASTYTIDSIALDPEDESILNITFQTAQSTNHKYKVTLLGNDGVDGILDGNGNYLLSGNGYFIGDGPFQVINAEANGPTSVILTFTENIKDSDSTAANTAANFKIPGLSDPVTSATWPYNGDKSKVELSTDTQLQQIYTIEVVVGSYNFHSADYVSGEPNRDTLQTGYNTISFQGDGIPIVSSAVSIDPTHIKVVFSEPVDKNTAETLTNYAIASSGYPSLSINGAARNPDPNTNEVILTTSSQLYVNYTVTVVNVQDSTGNTISGNNTATFAGIGTDNTPPSIISASAIRPAAGAAVKIRIYFNEGVDETSAETAANYTLSTLSIGTLTVTGTPSLPSNGETLEISVDSSSTGTDSITVTATDGTPSGSSFKCNASSNEYVAYSIAVAINSDPDSPVRAYADGTVVRLVSRTFGTDGDITITNSLTGVSDSSSNSSSLNPDGTLARSDDNTALVDINYTSLAAGVYQLAINNIGDLTIPTNYMSTAKTIVMAIKSYDEYDGPIIVGVYAVDSTHVKLLFNEPVDLLSANKKTNYVIERSIASCDVASPGNNDQYVVTYEGGTFTIIGKNALDLTASPPEFPWARDVAGIAEVLNKHSGSPVYAGSYGSKLYLIRRDTGSTHYISDFTGDTAVTNFTRLDSNDNDRTINAAVRNDDFPREVILSLDSALTTDANYIVTASYIIDVSENNNIGGNGIVLPIRTEINSPDGDDNPPEIVGIEALSDTLVMLKFNEELDETSAETLSYYSISSPDLVINSVVLDDTNPNIVLMYTEKQSALFYTLTVGGVQDINSNVMPSTSVSFTGIAAVSVDNGPVGNTINGIGNVKNLAITALEVFDDLIYAGSNNHSNNLGKNAEVYASDSTGVYFTLVSDPGFGQENHQRITSFEVFDSQLFASIQTSAGVDPNIFRTSGGLFPHTWNIDVTTNDQNKWTNLLKFGVTTSRLYYLVDSRIMYRVAASNYSDIVDFGVGTSTLIEFSGKMYIATSGAAIWRTKGTYAGDPGGNPGPDIAVDFEKVLDASNGIGMDGYVLADANNTSVMSLAVFKGSIYAGTAHSTSGAQIWRSQDGITWERVRDFGDSNLSAPYYDTNNTQISSMQVNGNFLYAGTMNSTDGAEAWRTPDGVSWNQFGTNGFGTPDYTDISSMCVFDGLIYFGMEDNDSGGAIFRSSN